MSFSPTKSAEIHFIGETHHGRRVILRNRRAGDDPVAHEAPGTVRGDVAVDQMPYLPYVVYQRERTACGDEYLHSQPLRLRYRVYSGLWDAVSPETHQSAVNVEEYSLNHQGSL